MRPELEAEFRDFAAARMEQLGRFGFLLCRDWHRAQDAVQTALTKLYISWPKLSMRNPDAYVRRVIANALHDQTRRVHFRREVSTSRLPDRPVSADVMAHKDSELSMFDVLAKLPPRQRLAVVLRYWEDQSVEHTAQIMGCSKGTVKSQAARGLETLRGLLAESHQVAKEGTRT